MTRIELDAHNADALRTIQLDIDASVEDLRNWMTTDGTATKIRHALDFEMSSGAWGWSAVRVLESTELERLQIALNEANALLKSSERQLAKKDQEMVEFKAKVREVAREYASSHGWCEVVEDALEEAGIETERPVHRIRFNLNVELLARTTSRRAIDQYFAGWTENSLQTGELEDWVKINASEFLDDDWTGVELSEVGFEFIGVEQVDA